MSALRDLQDTIDATFGRKPRLAVALIEERRKQQAAMSKARRLAKKHSIDLERDRDGYWVTHADFDDGDDDPCRGEHFCVGGSEVLTAVEAYINALAAKA